MPLVCLGHYEYHGKVFAIPMWRLILHMRLSYQEMMYERTVFREPENEICIDLSSSKPGFLDDLNAYHTKHAGSRA
jgi:hypothetical protein